MPKNTSIKSVLVIGSGPIVIGQAAEFDYAGTQACLALKNEGYKVILVNNNPATIMTDSNFADAIYFEPLTVDVLEKIIKNERPDGILPSFGGQTGLNLIFALSEARILEKYKVSVLGSSVECIRKGEDREEFRHLMSELNEPTPESAIVHRIEEAIDFSKNTDYPIIIRPAYTLGGTGGGIAKNEKEFAEIVQNGLQESPIHQCLIEKSIAGLKEIEFEVIRDVSGQCCVICDMENIDPVGVHTGDSIVVAPSQTLTESEYKMLRTSAIKIISVLEIIGACNIQFALDSKSGDYYVIEVNPRVSRSSALASKATGYPIASIATKLAIGYTLDELINHRTGETLATYEPSMNYIVVKIPKWPFDKFPHIDRKLSTQMKATGEVMALSSTFTSALLKAIQSLEIEVQDTMLPSLQDDTVNMLFEKLLEQSDERLFIIFELLRRGIGINELQEKTKIAYFFLTQFNKLVEKEKEIGGVNISTITAVELRKFKEMGFSDEYLAQTWNVMESSIKKKRIEWKVIPSFLKVDTVLLEDKEDSHYYYSVYEREQEVLQSHKRKVLIIGSGPIRIGQGIEFDYCSVHGVLSLKKYGIEAIMINNNPETVSTDFSVADKLYFEPLTVESILNVIEAEKITDCIVQLGGQTAINLAGKLESSNINIVGAASDIIEKLEDRELFYQLLDELQIPHLKGSIVHEMNELKNIVNSIGFPIMLRPSFVIGGKGMQIIHSQEELQHYMENENPAFPILADEFLHAHEAELDLVSDGTYIVAPAIMEHIEKTGAHSGDSIALIPAQSISLETKEEMLYYAKKIAQSLRYKGLMNIQYLIKDQKVFILEVNPRASRTVPIISKITGIPLVQMATEVLLGKYKLSKYDENQNLLSFPFVAVKYPVFSTYALKGLDSKLRPEMKSTGEGITIGNNYEEALRKAFHPFIKENGRIITADDAKVNVKNHQYEFIMSDDKNLLKGTTIAYYNHGEEEQDIALREVATVMRIACFTEYETLKAFCMALDVSDFGVKPIEKWHESLKKDVSTVW